MRTFEVVLSTKDRITIDEDDLHKIKTNAGSGNFIVLKAGVVNPSYIVTILPKGSVEKRDVIEEGLIDEARGVFVATKVKKDQPPIADEFAQETRRIADKFRA